MTTMLSAFWMVASLCAITRTVGGRSLGSLVCLWITRSRVACTLASESESSAEVASSKTSIRGCLMRARAIATRCCCPPLSRPSPTGVSYFAGKESMNSCALARSAASSISSSEDSGLPYAMLVATSQGNSLGSWLTTPRRDRNQMLSKLLSELPSI
mmetsp:Transcript_27098/g.51606  ORF Transcript_27098/g.51606 Transcript_27098/m.51606 type:complete len:157 (-) Transcript_27098:913-1383(-)